MPGKAAISVRVSPETKGKVDKIFKKLGISASDAINIFYQQVVLSRGLPFEVKLPNADTVEALMDVERDINLIKCKSAGGMFKKLGI